MMHYLIVDDHRKTRRAVIEALRQPGDEFIEAGTGEQALALYAETKPDWVIMDLKMPGQGGLVTTTQIVAQDPGAHVIILSQHDSPEFREAAREAGASAYVSKENLSDLECLMARLRKQSTKPS